MSKYNQLSIDRSAPGRWTVTFSNPPINILGLAAIDELRALVKEAEEDDSLKIVVFRSGNPEFFIAHFETPNIGVSTEAGPVSYAPWIELVIHLSTAPFVSIAEIRGRTRGVGNEFILACDMRFASRERAILGNPEVGMGLPPGGGALEWLPRLVGRSRALEIALSGDDFDAETAERYGWINRALDDDQLGPFVDRLAMRLATFDREALGAIKARINRYGLPAEEELVSSNELFFAALAWPGAKIRREKVRSFGYGVRGEFELNFGRYLPLLGQPSG